MIRKYGLIASLGSNARDAASAFSKNWVRVFEVSDSEKCREIRTVCSDAVIGVAGIEDEEGCRNAIACGTSYISTFGVDDDIACICRENETLYIPSCSTAAEIYQAKKSGCGIVKFYPAGLCGAVEMVKAFGERFPDVLLIPEGQVEIGNIGDYSCLKNVCAVQPSGLRVENVQEAVRCLIGFEMYHMGINMPSAADSQALAAKFRDAFGFEAGEGPFAYYSSQNLRVIDSVLFDCNKKAVVGGPGAFYQTADFEIMKTMSRGKNGHIGIRVNDGLRAVAYLEEKGWMMEPSTYFYTDGRIFTVYLKDEDFGGFAVHLLQKF